MLPYYMYQFLFLQANNKIKKPATNVAGLKSNSRLLLFNP